MKRSIVFSILLAGISAMAFIIVGCSRPAPPPSSPNFEVSDSVPWSMGYNGTVPRRELRSRLHGDRRIPVAGSSEELWIIERSDTRVLDERPNDQPRSGALVAMLPDSKETVPVPLKHTDVKADITGYIATVDVIQKFHNPYDGKIEASYVFPLPSNAAVNEFVMSIGERRIRGIIRERQEAKRIYDEAKSQGYVASLLTQERPNVFTQSVANIEPGKQIDIHIRYFHTLSYVDGWYEFVFPMVVGPRFNPPHTTDGIGAVARGKHGKSGQKTEIQYLNPNERSAHEIALAIQLNAGVDIERIESINHQIRGEAASKSVTRITLDHHSVIPNKDFVLRYKVAGERIKSSVIAQKTETGGYFTLMLFPPKELESLSRQPVEMVFVLDCSGSMSGQPLAQVKAAIAHAIHSMRPDDTFQIIRFSDSSSKMGGAPVPATPANVQRGLHYLSTLNSEGGTMMVEGIRAALDFPHDESRLRFVVFMTDGYIGNEAEIFREIHQRLGSSRIFSFGVGSSVNRYLLDEMARMGNGAAAYLSLNENAAGVMDDFFQRVSHPALTDLSIDFGGWQVSDVYPQRIGDLFVGRPVVVTGRFMGDANAAIKVRGRAGGEAQELSVPIDLGDPASQHATIAPVWARQKIADLHEQMIRGDGEVFWTHIRDVALHHGLMSAYTAFVAVDSMARTAAGDATTIAVPVPVPEGVKYETTVE